MKNYVIIFFLFLSITVSAQYNWDYGVQAGVSNYLGDIGGTTTSRKGFISDMKLAQTRWAPSAFVRYKFNRKLALRAQFSYLRIQGADSLTSYAPRHYRNLSFRNDIFELSATPQLTIYDNPDLGFSYRNKTAFNFYVFGGIGIMHHNPKAYYEGQWVALQPLHTEGLSYSLWQAVVPVGAGFFFTFKKKHRIGFEFNWRICFTDYLDDVHANYAQLSNPTAAALSNRTNTAAANAYQPGFANNYGVSTTDGKTHYNSRGNAKDNDTYMTMSLNYSYVLRGHGSFYKSRYGSFFFKRKRKRARKVRAKF